MIDWQPTGRVGFAAATFERFIDACLRADDESLLLALKRLHEVVESTTELTQVVGEMVAEAQGWWQRNQRAEDELRSEMIEFRRRLTDEFPQLGVSATVPAPSDRIKLDVYMAYEYSLAKVDRVGGDRIVKSRSLEPERSENQSSTATLVGILRAVTVGLGDDPAPGGSRARAQRAVRDLGSRVEWLHRERINQYRSSPIGAWLDIARRVAEINPTPKPEPQTFDVAELFNKAVDGLFEVPVEKILYGTGSKYVNVKPTDAEVQHFRAWRSDLVYRLGGLRDEVVRRLSIRRVVDAYLSRYAARCMWYRRDSLLEGVRRQRGRKRQSEQMLVADAAAFLFDQGFNVLTELTLGISRLDLLGFGSERPLLLEAKVYTRGSGEPELTKGYGSFRTMRRGSPRASRQPKLPSALSTRRWAAHPP